MKVFKHCGTTLGQGRVSTGLEDEVVEVVSTALEVVSTALEVVSADAVVFVVFPVGLVWTEVRVSVTGQIVVETATVTIVVATDRAGQFVTVSAQLVMVETEVVKMVDVLRKLVT